MSNLDTLLIKNQQVILQTTTHQEIYLPNLTTLVELYDTHKNTVMGNRIKEMLNHDIGTLLVMEIMIDATHPVTIERLKSGEISKNMKHVNDYNVVLTSNIENARIQYAKAVSDGLLTGTFEDCCFNTMSFGIVILRERFPQFKNDHYDKTAFENLF